MKNILLILALVAISGATFAGTTPVKTKQETKWWQPGGSFDHWACYWISRLTTARG
ncbi:MAG: hypothetical protein H0X41_03130 [Chitinophagaceae bacterium]|nr:hypothetical protein [Chitinophagaceae bacterium]